MPHGAAATRSLRYSLLHHRATGASSGRSRSSGPAASTSCRARRALRLATQLATLAPLLLFAHGGTAPLADDSEEGQSTGPGSVLRSGGAEMLFNPGGKDPAGVAVGTQTRGQDVLQGVVQGVLGLGGFSMFGGHGSLYRAGTTTTRAPPRRTGPTGNTPPCLFITSMRSVVNPFAGEAGHGLQNSAGFVAWFHSHMPH